MRIPAYGSATVAPPSLEINIAATPVQNCSRLPKTLRYTSDFLDESGNPALKIWTVDDGKFLRMAYSDGTDFWFDSKLQTIWVEWAENLSLDNALSYLLGPVLGVLLRLRGVVCLHGSAVAIEDSTVVFIGAPGAGKSTTAAAFARRGFAVLADDIAALDERSGVFWVLPGYPRVNLWPSSVQLLYGSAETLPVIEASGPNVEGPEKRFLALGTEGEARFEPRPLPLRAIYVLQPAEAEDTVEGTTITVVSKQTAVMALVANAYGTNVLDAQQRGKEFEMLTRLVESVPVRDVYARQKGLTLDALCELIRKDVGRLPKLSR